MAGIVPKDWYLSVPGTGGCMSGLNMAVGDRGVRTGVLLYAVHTNVFTAWQCWLVLGQYPWVASPLTTPAGLSLL